MAWSQPGQEAIIQYIGARTGLHFPPARHGLAEAGIARAMTRAGMLDLTHYLDRIGSDATAFDDLVAELTVGETYFFREPGQFEFVRREVIPEIRARRGDQHVMRAWSAACASGEEAYSLAILFTETGLAGKVCLLATDISRAALAKAGRGEYRSWSLRDTGAQAAGPYLRTTRDGVILHEAIRRLPTFEHLNLAQDVYPSLATGTWGMDLIFCRNVLIYFDQELVRAVARRLYEALAPGGWLFTASTDPPLSNAAPFESVVRSEGVFYRRPPVTAPAPEVRLPIAGNATPRFATTATDLVQPARKASRRSSIIRKASRASLQSPAEPAPLAEARQAFIQGDYVRACQLTETLPEDAATRVVQVKALANLDVAAAERTCAEATARHPLSTDLQYLHAVLLVTQGRLLEASGAARRTLYLDRTLAIAHFTLGSILRSLGDPPGARKAYRNAREICAARPPDEAVPLSDGERAGRLAEAAASQLTALDAVQEAAR
jgi:chemotaxis protein methyltransferase CheR